MFFKCHVDRMETLLGRHDDERDVILRPKTAVFVRRSYVVHVEVVLAWSTVGLRTPRDDKTVPIVKFFARRVGIGLCC